MARLIGTAGHIDHGKTSLIRALTGIDADRLPEEKRRGLTIDIGFAHIELPEIGRVSIVDVPGHEKFLANMLVGALGMDVALLCVAADSSVMPQTVEHFQIIELLPVDKVVVAVTRADLVDGETLAITREEVEELLEPTRFKGSPIVPVSAVTGSGLDELRAKLADALRIDDAPTDRTWYLPVDRAFAMKGHGVVVTGTLAHGTVSKGETAVIQPEGHEVRIRAIQSHDEEREAAVPGTRVALNLSGIKLDEVHRGQVIGPLGGVFASRIVDGNVRWLVQPKHGSRVRVSIGADEAIARVFLNDQDAALVQLRFERDVAATKGQPFIVRRYSPPTLLGGGTVTVPEATARTKRTRVAKADSGSLEDSILSVVDQFEEGVSNDELCRLLGKSAQSLGSPLENLKSSAKLLGFAGLWLTPEQLVRATTRFASSLSSLHEKDPTNLFQKREDVTKAAGLSWSGKPLDRIISHLTQSGAIRSQGTGVALATFKVKFSDKQRALLDRVVASLSQDGVSAPSPIAVADALKVPRPAVNEIIKVGVAAGEIVRIDEDIYLSRQTLDATVTRMRKEYEGRQFTAADFRGLFETSRKYAIPFLEYCDSKNVTKRMGDVRVLVTPTE